MAAAAVFLAVLGSCDSDPVIEPEPSLEIVPDSVTLTHIGDRFAFTVRGGEAVRWNSLDLAVFTVDTDGTVTARGNGTAQVQAWTPESSDHALVRVRQLADVLEAFGEGQRAAAGLSLIEPVGVRVLDAGGAPISGLAVRFEPGAGDGRVEPVEAQTDSTGVVAALWTLGQEPGPHTLAVSADDASVEITATALHPDEAVASVEILSGEDQWAVVGHALPDSVTVRVTDEAERLIRGASVRFEPEAGGGRADPGVTVTDSLGLAAAVWTLGPESGAQRMVVTAGGLEAGFDATAVSDEGICNRTPAVSAVIVDRLVQFHHVQVSGCAEVTEAALGRIDLLQLHRKGITRLASGDFAGLVALEVLYLHENELAELPAGVFDGLSRLRSLYLDDNQLVELPPRLLAHLGQLQILDLGDNRLSVLTPDIFGGLSRLRTLDLGSNELTQLPSDIFEGLSSLKNLHLSHNGLTELPEDVFDGLSNIELLTIRGNELTSLPEGIFSGLSRLADLRVGDNRLTELAADLFSEVPNIHRLDLERNELTGLPPGLLLETPMLQRLFLKENRMKMLPPDVFEGLPNLFRLALQRNDLAELPPDIFAGTPRLAELGLEYNQLAELPPGLFAGLSELEWVTLHSNPGAPFSIRPEFVRVDAADRLAPSPARVVVNLATGAPFAFTVPLSVQRGTISREVVSLLPGDTVSTVFEVSASADGGAVHVGFEPLSAVAPEGYEGLALARGEELVLFAESDNRSPLAGSTIPAHRLQAGGPSADLVLHDYFDDPDGDSLAYAVETAKSGVVAARIEDGVLWLDPMSVDTTEIEVTANDPGGLRATHRFQTWVVPAPDPDAFNIELYFDPGFTAEEEAAVRRAADRWMEAVTGDLPDVPVQGLMSDYCYGESPNLRLVGVIDDLLIRMRFVARQGGNVATATTCGVREASGQAFLGESWFTLWYVRGPHAEVEDLYRSAMHEIGHVLGFGYWRWGSSPKSWRELFRHGDGDGHFAGPLAVAAFNAAGGEAYAGGKVPLEDRIPVLNIHWRKRVIPGDIMAPGGGSLLTAITIQALADLGYEVDVSKADTYTLPMAAQGDALGDFEVESGDAEVFVDDVIKVPLVVVDRDGKVVRIIRP
ncbi:leucine-rich repeat protein [Candidatus Palauibacter sp.]|uniref:leucine-rich repeat protein n=1 Tax=Candidatus Palauibacter sp. TaxID=3101350 RepID=UPI003B5ADF7B